MAAGIAHAQADNVRSGKSFADFLQSIDKVSTVPRESRNANSAERASQLGSDSTTDNNTAQASPLVDDSSSRGPQESLTLADVIASLYVSFPEIQRARREPAIAGGELLSAYGAYDSKFHAESLSEPTGFYVNYRNGLGLARQTWWGGYAAAGYRIGRGDFQPWYKERETNEAGEFKVAFSQPLLQGRAIDAQRVAVFRASLAQQAADPLIQLTILDTARSGAIAYWDWVTTGQFLVAQRELLELAKKRGEQFEVGLKAGKFAEVDVILNTQLIAERQAKMLESEQKFRDTSFKLSLYLRDEDGRPLVPEEGWLPIAYPAIERQAFDDVESDLAGAMSRRPEPQLLQIEIQQVQLDRQLARNEMLPQLNLIGEASQDMGPRASRNNDKGEFELLLGVASEVPIQRRKARGKLQSTAGKIAQVNEKLRITQDKIAVEIQSAANALRLTKQIVEQNEAALKAARDALVRYRFAFDSGKIDLIYLNLLETKVNETEIKVAEAHRNWFIAIASMQFALGLDPLDQAMQLSNTELSEMPPLVEETVIQP
jgi:outer membrane protein TolC